MVAGKATNARSAAASTRKTSRSSAARRGEAPAESPSLRERLRLLYLGKSQTAHRFRYGLLVFDIGTILFIIGTSFVSRAPWIEWLDGRGQLERHFARCRSRHHGRQLDPGARQD